MIGVTALTYDAASGLLTVVCDDEPRTTIEAFGRLSIDPRTPAKGEAVSWDLLLHGAPSDPVGRHWARLTVQPPPELELPGPSAGFFGG